MIIKRMIIGSMLVAVLAMSLHCSARLSLAGPLTWPEISKNDFYNHTYHCDSGEVTLKCGQFKKSKYEFWWLAYLDFVDIDGDGAPEAIVSLRNYPATSKLWTDDVFIFKVVKGRLRQLAHLWKEDLESISVVDGLLVIVAPYWSDNDAHCCPSQKERAVYSLKADKLEKINSTFTKIERK